MIEPAELRKRLAERAFELGFTGFGVTSPTASPQLGESLEAWLEAGYLPREGFQYQWFRQGASTFEQYLERFSSKQRNQVRRELRA